jgi:putative iron-regulated protein
MYGKPLGSLAVGLALLAAACSSGADTEGIRREAVENYANVALEAYANTLAAATSMDVAIDAFIADPTEDNLRVAKQAWLDARNMYGVTEVFRFYGGPIDRAVDGVEGLVNTWPLDEAYIDYVEGDSESGIVNDPVGYPTIDPSVLTAANENGGETNVATGWHAIEFLLWGQDLDTEGPGARPATDYSTAPNADRRGQYLAVLSDLLLVHLGGLVEEWEPDQDNYRTEFLALDTDQALGMILTGMGELTIGELAGERLTVAYEERSHEDEQSCFSDNTTNDYLANIAGIEAVANGTFESVSGVGIVDAIAVSDADAADRLSRSIDVSKAAAESIEPPLDQYLVVGIPDSDPGRVAMLSTIEALEAQAIAIASAATVLGVEVG